MDSHYFRCKQTGHAVIIQRLLTQHTQVLFNAGPPVRPVLKQHVQQLGYM